jgi:hypothetical protein
LEHYSKLPHGLGVNMAGLLALIPVLGDIIDKVIPDPNKRIELNLELARIADQEAARESAERIAQTEVNKAEAGHSSTFVAGWRPAVGWSCVAGFLYTVILAPATGLPVAEVTFLRDILLGMLGISVAARSVEKIKGVAQNSLNPTAVTPIATPLPPKPKKKVLGVEWPF